MALPRHLPDAASAEHAYGSNVIYPLKLNSTSITQSSTNGEIEYGSYIVQLSEPPLANTYAKAKGSPTLAFQMSEQKSKITAEQDASISAIKSKIGPASVSGLKKFANTFNGLLITASASDAKKILGIPGVKAVYPNVKVNATLMDSVPLVGAPVLWGLDANGNNCTTTASPCINGVGMKIAIIDTGIDYTHPDLGGCFGLGCKVAGGYDFVNLDKDPMDDHGHGTHCAGIAAGNGVLKGVAPGATLYAYKVLNSGGSGYSSGIILAIEASVDPDGNGNFDDRMDVISLSLGGSGDPDDPMSQAIDAAADAGVVAAVAAGNNYAAYTIGSPGTAKKAITVGAAYKFDPQIAPFSSKGPVLWDGKTIVKPDIVAPGVSICSAQYDGWQSQSQCLDNLHVAASGTSMATPHVAGAAALIRQMHPDWFPGQVKSALKAGATYLNYSPLWQGSGRLYLPSTAGIQNPPVVVLEPISAMGYGTIRIAGTVDLQGSPNVSLYYMPHFSYEGVPGQAENWTLLSSQMMFSDPFVFNWDLNPVPDGEYVLKLETTSPQGIAYADYGFVKIDKFRLETPQYEDIYRAGAIVGLNYTIQGNINGILQAYFYPSSSPGQITPINNTAWNTTGLQKGHYFVVVNFTHNGIIETETARVYLDPALKPGFPVRVPWSYYDDPVWGKTYYFGGPMAALPTDMDNDGKMEILTFKWKSDTQLYSIGENGSIKWIFDINDHWEFPPNYHFNLGTDMTPVVADLNNDGKKEALYANPIIRADNNGVWYLEETFLFAVGSDGKPYSGWNSYVKLPFMWSPPKILVEDLNNDSNKEIVLAVMAAYQKDIMVLDKNGNIISHWFVKYNDPYNFLSFMIIEPNYPSIGNFDGDSDLEIVYATQYDSNDKGVIHVFNMDGSEVAGWPVYTDGFPWSSASVGDISGDGKDDIVIGLGYYNQPYAGKGGIVAIGHDGSMLPGWPVENGKIIRSSVSLADFDNDSVLEVAASSTDNTMLIDGDGTLMAGWPYGLSWNDYGSPALSDLDSNGQLDIAVTAGCGYYGGGVYLLDSLGMPLMAPLYTEADAQAPAAIADIDGDGKLEIVAGSDWDYNFETGDEKKRGSIYAWDLEAYASNSTIWPMNRRQESRQGYYPSMPSEGKAVEKCADSDKGLDFEAKGTCKGPEGKSLTDQCIDSHRLNEAACQKIAGSSASTDADGATSPGKASGATGTAASLPKEYSDTPSSLEVGAYTESCAYAIYNCPAGTACSDGACIKIAVTGTAKANASTVHSTGIAIPAYPSVDELVSPEKKDAPSGASEIANAMVGLDSDAYAKVMNTLGVYIEFFQQG